MKDTLDDYVMRCLSNMQPWTFWSLQEKINQKTGKFYGEPSISAAIRNVRKPYMRERWSLPHSGEVVIKERIPSGKGYQYRLTTSVITNWSNKDGICK